MDLCHHGRPEEIANGSGQIKGVGHPDRVQDDENLEPRIPRERYKTVYVEFGRERGWKCVVGQVYCS